MLLVFEKRSLVHEDFDSAVAVRGVNDDFVERIS